MFISQTTHVKNPGTCFRDFIFDCTNKPITLGIWKKIVKTHFRLQGIKTRESIAHAFLYTERTLDRRYVTVGEMDASGDSNSSRVEETIVVCIHNFYKTILFF